MFKIATFQIEGRLKMTIYLDKKLLFTRKSANKCLLERDLVTCNSSIKTASCYLGNNPLPQVFQLLIIEIRSSLATRSVWKLCASVEISDHCIMMMKMMKLTLTTLRQMVVLLVFLVLWSSTPT